MESERMELIARKSKQLANLINFDDLLPFIACVKIFTIPEIEVIYNEENDILRTQIFLQELITRGSDALDKFIKALKAAEKNEAIQLLCENGDGFSVYRESYQSLCDAVCDLDLRAEYGGLEQPSFDVYQMNSIPHGYCLIINNVNFNDLEETRAGSDIDALRLKMIFKYLGYCVSAKRDLTAEQMTEALSDFSKQPEHKNVDSCIVVLLSHGLEGIIKGTDAKNIYINNIIEMFDNASCPNLKGKPKLFFVNACRGCCYDNGVEIGSTDAGVPSPELNLFIQQAVRRMPVVTDVFISYSTIEGYVSKRDDDQGSWYCQSLCGIFKEFASKIDFQDMLAKVNREVANRMTSSGEMQATEIVLKGWSGKRLYFNIL